MSKFHSNLAPLRKILSDADCEQVYETIFYDAIWREIWTWLSNTYETFIVLKLL